MFTVIFLPDFFLQAALRPEPDLRSRAVALIDEQLPKAGVVQLTPAARAAGVVEGLTPTQAVARCRDIIIKTRSLAQELTAGETLLQCAYTFSPAVEATAPGICTLDLKGLMHSFDEAFGRKVIDALVQFHLRAQVGVAENPGLALNAARCARPFLAVQHAAAFLAALPIESIEPSPEVLSILGKWGIRTLGEFTSLGKERVAERLDVEGVDLFERASATATRPLRLARPPEVFEEAIEFEQEIESLEPLLFILRRFIEQLAARLELSCLVAEELRLRLRLSSGAEYERVLPVPAPTRDPATLFRLLHTHLETVRTGHPIVALHLRARPGRPLRHQFGLFETSLRDPNQFYETLARLMALLGADRVGTPEVESTHRPDAFRMRPVDFELQARNPKSEIRHLLGLCFRRYRPSLHATVEVRDHQPVFLRTGKVAAPIVKAQGPWRSSGDWWDRQHWQREEWDAQTRNGELYRLAQVEEEWFLEGVYD
jgi:protein ImuB